MKKFVEKAIAEGVEAKKVLDERLLPGITVIVEKFKNNEVYVPEVLIAARAMCRYGGVKVSARIF